MNTAWMDRSKTAIGDTVTGLDGHHYRVRLEQDPDADSPREFSNTGIMVLSHRRYDLPREGDLTAVIEDAFERGGYRLASRYLIVTGQALIVLPVFGYEHGSLHLSTGRHGVFADPWDSGLAGLIYADPESVREGWGDQVPDMDTLAAALAAEVDEYDRWANGDVYGYIVERETVPCEHCGRGAGEWEHVDSCWGFIGAEYAEGAARDALRAELHAVAAEVCCAFGPDNSARMVRREPS